MTKRPLLMLVVLTACSNAASGGDAGSNPPDSGPRADGATSSADSGTPADGGDCTIFSGRYVAVDVRCNGAPYARMELLTPPAGGWYVEDDGTEASFTQTVGSCSLVATGHIGCDSPAVGQLTHVPEHALTCAPDGCAPFAAQCDGTAVGAHATWTYELMDDGRVRTTSVGDTPIRTCTGAGQENPVEVIWEPVD
jgi:hypothetical protein